MKKFASITLVALLAATGTSTFAGEKKASQSAAPLEMSDAQMDSVAGGIANFNNLVAIDVNTVLNNNDVQGAVPVNAAVAVGAVGILSRQTGILTEAAAPGRLNQNP